MKKVNACPSCGRSNTHKFYECKNVPVNSVLLMRSRQEALDFKKSDIVLVFCKECGFVFNEVFDPNLLEYSSRYESTQSFSPTFTDFHKSLAMHLIDRYDLHGKNIIEIGCGEGEFLSLLCKEGSNHAVGFDPSCKASDNKIKGIEFVKDKYSLKYADYPADFICCKMTLEHIQEVSSFIKTIRTAIEKKPDTVLFFQVPNASRILQEKAFWDIYYEHCSYFSMYSLGDLFKRHGFYIIDMWKGYSNQYIMIEVSLKKGEKRLPVLRNESLENLKASVSKFSSEWHDKISYWKQALEKLKKQKKRAVIWGGGSKGVSFLTTLDVKDEISYVVDINPKKHKMYMPLTGHEIIGPDFLKRYRPDTVIVANPVYLSEIASRIKNMKLSSDILSMQH